MNSLHWDSMIRGHRAYKGKILCVEHETYNAEDCFTEHFTVAIVKAETIVGHVTRKFSLLFPVPLSNFQLRFSGVTLPLMPCIWACAPTYQPCLTTSNEHALNRQYVLNKHVHLTT